MPVLVAIFTWLLRITPVFLFLGKCLGFLWKYLKVLAMHKATWYLMAFYPIIELLIEMFTGNQGIISHVISGFLLQILNLILQFTFNINAQTVIDQLPANAVQVGCYLGINSALQFVFDGILNAMVVLTILKLNIFIAILKIRAAKLIRM